ncbi:MAG: hypothetical protein L3J74_04360 [Bacteroidales bacterium]|nr:hypothetical protein [Bacteroidales bacterium]
MRTVIKNSILYVFLAIGLAVFTHAVFPYYQFFNIECETTEHHTENEIDPSTVYCHLLDEIIDNKVFLNTNFKILSPVSFQNDVLFNTDFEIQNKTYTKLSFFVQDFFPNYFVCIDNTPSRGSPA